MRQCQLERVGPVVEKSKQRDFTYNSTIANVHQSNAGGELRLISKLGEKS